MAEMPFEPEDGVRVADYVTFGRPLKAPPAKTFLDELRHLVVDESPFQARIAPVAPPRRKPTAAEIAEKRVLKSMDELEKAMGSAQVRKETAERSLFSSL